MDVISHIPGLRKELKVYRNDAQSIGLVPTMGNLHEGHLHLIKEALKENNYTVVTIFVNPLQFSPNEDFNNYPRTLNQDIEKLKILGCNCVFVPNNKEIFDGQLDDQTRLRIPRLSEIHCGKSRPGHFDGVATIVCKLLNIVNPNIAYFGLKDYQQYLIIKKLVADLEIPVRIKGIETIRNKQGLTLSSRNNYLSSQQLNVATQLFVSIGEISRALLQGNKNFSALEDNAKNQLSKAGLLPDYCAICHAETLRPATSNDLNLVILIAAHLGSVRLIDNLCVSLSH